MEPRESSEEVEKRGAEEKKRKAATEGNVLFASVSVCSLSRN